MYLCDGGAHAAADGALAKAELSCAVTALSGQNTAACVLKYRVRGTDSWTEKTVTAPGGTVFPADTGSDYQALLTASDRFTAVSSGILTLPAAFALLDFDRKNKAVGIGQRAGTGSTISLGLPVKMGGNRITDIGAPTDSTDAATKGYADAAAGASALSLEEIEASDELSGKIPNAAAAEKISKMAKIHHKILTKEYSPSGSTTTVVSFSIDELAIPDDCSVLWAMCTSTGWSGIVTQGYSIE